MRMGFPVPKRTEPYCYNGVPTASILHAAKSRTKGQGRGDKVKATVGTSLTHMFNFGSAFQGMLSVLGFSVVILAGIFISMHLLNIYTVPSTLEEEAIRAKIVKKERKRYIKHELTKAENAIK